MNLQSQPNFLRNALKDTPTLSSTEHALQVIEEQQPKFPMKQNRSLNKKGLFFLMAGLSLTGMSVYAGYQYYNATTETKPLVENNRANSISIPDFDSTRPLAVASANTQPATSQNITEPEKPIISEKKPITTPTITPPPTIALPEPTPYYEPPSNPQLMPQTAQMPDDSAFFKDEFSEVKRGAVRSITNAETVLPRGTYIRCILETKIVSDIQGFTSCVLPNPVYSLSGDTILLPKGSRVTGEYQSNGALGNRIAVNWQRIITSNKLDVRLDSPGVGVDGSSGHLGKAKTHWLSRFGNTVMVSMISDVFKVAAQEYGPRTTVSTDNTTYQNPFESNTAAGINNFLTQSLNSTTNRPPTVTVNQGSIINIFVARDIDFAGQREAISKAN